MNGVAAVLIAALGGLGMIELHVYLRIAAIATRRQSSSVFVEAGLPLEVTP